MMEEVQSNLEDIHQEAAELEFENLEGNSVTTVEEDKTRWGLVSEFSALYKANPLVDSQEKRRKILLETQKRKREQMHDENRGITEDLENDENSEESDSSSRRRNFRKTYENVRPMYSEWLREVPEDLESEWCIKLCPVGVRNIIIANNYSTRAFKNGKLKAKFESKLPAGGQSFSGPNSLTVLDCIYNDNFQTIFVLDVLIWKGQNLCTSPASLRFFWLNSRLNEIDVQEITSENEYRIIPLPEFSAELHSIEEQLNHPYKCMDEIIPLDGVLFYHKETWYKRGRTPLVGWLKPYMVPEKLHVPVCEYFLEKKPDSYVSLEHYLLNRPKNKTDVVMKEACEEAEDMAE